MSTNRILTADIISGLNIAKSYIANGNAEQNTNGYATYKDAAQSTPVDGVGGSPTLTFTRSTSSPLSGIASFLITTTAANLQGEGASYDFNLNDADMARIMAISCDYSIASGTYVDGDMTMYVAFSVDGGSTYVVSQPSGFSILNIVGPAGKQIATVQTPYVSGGGVKGRLIFHRAVSTASAMTMKIDNIVLGPQVVQYGAPITDPVPFAGSTTAFGTPTQNSLQQYRDGAFLHIFGVFRPSAVSGSVCAIELPSNLTIDTAYYSVLSSKVGDWETITSTASNASFSLDGSTNAIQGHLFYDGSDNNSIYFATSATAVGFNKRTSTQIADATAAVHVDIKVKIAGWLTNVIMSDSAETRAVAFSGSLQGSGTVPSLSAIPFVVSTDNHNGYSNGAYTISVPGWYEYTMSGETYLGTGYNGFLQIRKNSYSAGTLLASRFVYGVGAGGVGNGTGYCSGVDYFVAGDTINAVYNANSGNPGYAALSTKDWTFTVKKVSGPATIAASESVNVRYYGSATSISGSLTTIDWTTKDFDSHNKMVSGVYTIPVSGKYQIDVGLLVAGTIALNTTCILELQRNGIVVSRNTEYAGGAITNQKGWIDDIISCMAGDTIRIQVSSSATLPSIVSSNFDNYFSLARVGN